MILVYQGCYYAMFYSTEAILLTNNLKASSHKGVISLFGGHFIKTGKLDREFAGSSSRLRVSL
nr:HEPN domain-containing protein [Candidatus Bathyarchaeota archaeon]